MKDFIAREGSMPAIIDFTSAMLVGIESSTAVNRGRSGRFMVGQPRVFVTTDPLLFGMLRVYGACQDSIGERPPAVVRSLAEAFQELSLTDPDFEPLAVEPRRHDAVGTSDAQLT